MDREIEMKEISNDRISQRFEFPFSDEDDLPKSEIHIVESDSHYSYYMTTSVTSSLEQFDLSGNRDEGLELSIPHSSPSKLQQDNCHLSNQITVTPIMATPTSNQTSNMKLYSAGLEIKSTDEKGHQTAEAAEGPIIDHTPIEDNHLAATAKLYPKTDFDLSILHESYLKKVEIEGLLYPPYMPLGGNGPQITMSTAIDILNRYCGSLSSDQVRLSPVWDDAELCTEQATSEWLRILYITFKPDTLFKWLYRQRLLLPLNSPLREEVVGDLLPSRRWAKRAAAFKACIVLHKLGELGDDLRPVRKVDPLVDQPMCDENGQELSGTSKGKQCRHKKTRDVKRMEVLGDSLLKLATSIFVYGQSTRSRKCTEDWLSALRMRQICDRNLNRLGKNPELGSTIIAEEFDLATNFVPPCVSLVGEHNNKRLYQMASDKNIAGCVKALAGASLLAKGEAFKMAGTMKFLKRIGLNTVPEGLENDVNPENGFPRLANCVRLPSPKNGEDDLNYLDLNYLDLNYLDLCFGLQKLEAKIKYTFKDKTLLIEALSHPTEYTNRLTVSYHRLAFLGDAVLDYLVTKSYFDDERKYSPADLMDLRSTTVTNTTFGVMAARHDFQRFLKYLSGALSFAIQRFLLIQERYDHQIPDDYDLLYFRDSIGADVAYDLKAPKVYGDIFKSVAGAIFIDSDMSLETVWELYYPFLHQEMDKFRCSIPKCPIRLLHEKYPDSVFRRKKDLHEGRVCVAVEIEGKSYHGAGFNSMAAKRAAAKYALRCC